MVEGMTHSPKKPADTRLKKPKTTKAALRQLKKTWPALTALAMVGIFAVTSVMASAPSVIANPLAGPSSAASAEPKPATTHLPDKAPDPGLGVPFFADGPADSTAMVTVEKGTYSEGAPRQLVLRVQWRQVGGDLTPDPSLLKVTSSSGAPAGLAGEAIAEGSSPDSPSDRVLLYTYDVGPGDAAVTVQGKYTEKPTTFTIPS